MILIQAFLTSLVRMAPSIIETMHTYPRAANKYLLLAAMVCVTPLVLVVLLT